MKLKNLPRPATEVLRRSIPASVVCLMLLTCAGPTMGQPRSRQLVPASLSPTTDSQGFTWDVHQNGHVQRGTNCFSSAFVLAVNGNSFQSARRMMTKDGSELVFFGTAGGLQVTRTVRVDAKSATIRYVDAVKNPGPTPLAVSLRLTTSLNNNPAQTVVTNGGSPGASVLGPKDSGLVVFSNPGSRQLSVLFFLAGTQSKLKPQIRNESNYRFYFTYSVSIPPGKSTSIIHGAAQRRLASMPAGKQLDELFKPFVSRSWTRDLTTDVKRSIVNLGKTSRSGRWESGEVLFTIESLDVEPADADVLAVGDETRLQGKASCSSMLLETPYGPFQGKLSQIAAITGGKFGDVPRVFLRDGQVLTGNLVTEDLHFTLKSGVKLELIPVGLDRLLLRDDPEKDKEDDQEYAMVETVGGDRIALGPMENETLSLATPWGERKLPFEEIVQLVASREPLGHRVILLDGTRLFGFLNQDHVRLETREFANQQLPIAQLRAVYGVENATEEESIESADVSVPHLVLAGENLVLGAVDLASIGFSASGQDIPIPPNQIRVMRNVTGQHDGTTDSSIYFEAELWDGSNVRGALKRTVLPVRSADGVLLIPVGEIEEIHVPVPTVPDTLRVRIASLIRDLGHAEFEIREESTKELAELGYLAKSQLDEALRQASDPEIKRRIDKLVENLSEWRGSD